MELRIKIPYAPILLFIWFCVGSVAYDEKIQCSIPGSTPDKDSASDCAATNSIKEMIAKLEEMLGSQGFCSNNHLGGTELPRPCIDLTSSQSVVTQLCDRISSLGSMVNSLVSKVNSRPTPKQNNHSPEETKPFTDIAKLREELKHVQRSAVFYASRTEKFGNVTSLKVVNYNTTVNTGPYFDPVNGIFAAPFNGVYHFSLSYHKTPEVQLSAGLVVNSKVIASTSEELLPKIDILTSLESGQFVWTDITSNSGETNPEVKIVFSGFLVH